MVSPWRERRGRRQRCWATKCAASVVTRPLVSITTCWAVKAVRASFDAASLKVPSTPARTTDAVKWTCTCAASASSAACANVGRRACWSSVSARWVRHTKTLDLTLFFSMWVFRDSKKLFEVRGLNFCYPSLTCRCALRGTNSTEEDEEAARGGNGPHVHSGHPHPSAGSSRTGPPAAGDDWEAGGHAEAMQQEVFPGPTKSHGRWILDSDYSLFFLHYAPSPFNEKLSNFSLKQPWPQSQDLQNREVRQQRFAHFTELAIMSVQEIVDFAKQLPGFLELTREDQIALLKTSTIEVCHGSSWDSVSRSLSWKSLFYFECAALLLCIIGFTTNFNMFQESFRTLFKTESTEETF